MTRTIETIETIKAKYGFRSINDLVNPKYGTPDMDFLKTGQDIYPTDLERIMEEYHKNPTEWFSHKQEDEDVIELDDGSAQKIADYFNAENQIEFLIAEAHSMIAKAESLADKHNLGFNWDLSYGMGGYYDGEEGEWRASSESC